MFGSLKLDGAGGKAEVFADGWLNSEGAYDGCPVDVAELPNGSLVVSDDFAGAFYRITYEGDRRPQNIFVAGAKDIHRTDVSATGRRSFALRGAKLRDYAVPRGCKDSQPGGL